MLRKCFTVTDDNHGSWILLDSVVTYFESHKKATDSAVVTYDDIMVAVRLQDQPTSVISALSQPASVISALSLVAYVFLRARQIDACWCIANRMVAADLNSYKDTTHINPNRKVLTIESGSDTGSEDAQASCRLVFESDAEVAVEDTIDNVKEGDDCHSETIAEDRNDEEDTVNL